MPDILKQVFIERVYFDPSNAAHVESFKCFISTGNWGDIQFYPELPYIEVPITVLMKFALHQLNTKRETEEERVLRHSKKNLVPWGPIETRKEQRRRLEVTNIKIFDQLKINAEQLAREDEDS